MKLTGQCLCGNITYSCDAEIETMTYCHCDTCRRATGSAFNIGVGVPKPNLHVSGQIQTYKAPNGVERQFCPTCGSPLFTVGNRSVWIRAGSLNDAEALKPTREIWKEMKMPWAHIPEDIDSFPQTGQSTDG
jgi:hypothetical protein